MRCVAVCIEGWKPPDELFNRLVGLLDDAARTRIQAFKFRQDALANLVGRLLPLWEACSLNGLRHIKSLQQAREEKGRPYLVDNVSKAPLDYDFNISHDGEVIAMASKTSPQTIKLGIDVMRVGLPAGIPDISEFEATLEDMLSTYEKETLKRAQIYEKVGLLLDFWTSKEAVSKALGEGLTFPYAKLDSISLQNQGTCMVRGRKCVSKNFECSMGSHKYKVCCARLGDTDFVFPEQLEIIPIDELIEEVFTMSLRDR